MNFPTAQSSYNDNQPATGGYSYATTNQPSGGYDMPNEAAGGFDVPEYNQQPSGSYVPPITDYKQDDLTTYDNKSKGAVPDHDQEIDDSGAGPSKGLQPLEPPPPFAPHVSES